MGPRYIAVLGDPGTEVINDVKVAMARREEMVCHADADGLTLYADTSGPVTRLENAGFVIGRLFTSQGDRLTGPAAAALAPANASQLLTDHWGAYVAILKDGQAFCIIRDPSGMLPCYYCRHRGATIVTSDVATAVGSGVLRPEIDWRALASHLVADQLRRPGTCVAGLTELSRGAQLTVDAGTWAHSVLWSPWRFADWTELIRDEAAAVEALHEVTMSCLRAWARCFDKILLSVSGGLDSSIVACGLAHAGADFACFNLVTEDPVGDEREFARILCAAVGSALFEVYRDAARIDLTRSHASHLPRPIARSFAQEMDRISLETAAEIGATAFFGGGGGDSLFCYLQSAAPVADRLLVEGPGRGVLATTRSMSRQAECSFLTVAAMAVRRAWFRPPGFHMGKHVKFLSGQAIRSADAPVHPWLEAPAHSLPGKAAHIANLLTMENHMEGFARERMWPNVSPLMSQPLIELCLRIPTWMWCSDGRNRMAARRAFANALPDAIVNRTGKGSPGGFEIEVFERNRTLIRDMLAGGLLASHGLLDLPAIETALMREGPVRGTDHRRLLMLVDVEAWLRSYC